MQKKYFSYIRVSTAKQGEHGVSLKEQQDAINRYAQKSGLAISQSFEEQETAAKRGRPVFTTMLRLLKTGRANGVIIHKIDRSARNLRDWADLGELIDAGVEVHFANESLDLNTRGGRLSADIQAVVASDYIRNLREETRKGFYGRLKQGLYPLRAPLGYLDQGSGKPKTIDPVSGPLVQQAFELYATGNYSLWRLAVELNGRGLRNRRGEKVSVNGFSRLLSNPFYIGLIRLTSSGEVFPGIHLPLVSKQTFDRVQQVLEGKTINRATAHDFMFRRLLRCTGCRFSLIGERQKGRVYYRCHSKDCLGTSVREDSVDGAVASAIDLLRLDEEEIAYVRDWIHARRGTLAKDREVTVSNLKLQLDQIGTRLGRLTDAYIDGVLDKVMLEERRKSLVYEQAGLKERLRQVEAGLDDGLTTLEQFLELAKTASNLYKIALPEEKRDFVRKLTSNLGVAQKNVDVVLNSEAQVIASRRFFTCSSPNRGTPRTWDALLTQLLALFEKGPELGHIGGFVEPGNNS